MRSGRRNVFETTAEAEVVDAIMVARLAFTVERPVEGDHATVHKEIRLAPNHTEALVSLGKRLPEMRSFLLSEPERLPMLAQHVQSARAPLHAFKV